MGKYNSIKKLQINEKKKAKKFCLIFVYLNLKNTTRKNCFIFIIKSFDKVLIFFK